MGSLCDPGHMGPLAKRNKKLEYLNFCLLCALLALIFYLYIRIKKYFPLLKMAEELIGNLGYDLLQLDTKHQKLLKCILTGNSKLYLERFPQKISSPNLAKKKWKNSLIIIKLSFQARWCNSLACSIINMYSMGVCKALGISDQDVLSEDLENDPFLNSALQRFTCELYYIFRSLLAPLSIGIITSRHYLYEHNKNGGKSGDNGGPTTTEWGDGPCGPGVAV